MPSPVFHLAAGAATAHVLGKTRAPGANSWRFRLVCLACSMLPDLDAVPGILLNRMADFHNNISHSPAFGLAACLLLSPVLMRLLPGWRWQPVMALSCGSYLLHVAFDWMTYGRGVMLGWPLTDERFHAPFNVFRGVRWSEGLISPEHLPTLANEVGVMLLLALLYLGARRVSAR